MQHLLRREAQQVACRGGGGERAGRAGGVEGLVVRAAEKLADANADLVAGDRRGDQLATRSAERLCGGERGREHDRGRMEHRAVVHIVLLGDVRGGGVHHRGEERCRAAARDQHFAGATGGAHLAREALDGFDRADALAGQGRAEPVEQQVFSAAHHRVRDPLETQLGGEGGERLRRVVHQTAFAARNAAMSCAA